ncbi:415_t:CDS:1 [Acaulospora morrowiae]|uniref:415_t:CDS:1 n=1 Tax=Acaulospora morrowiae TaxID=94023 RepID=A0A9N8W4I6_9GLOM|nr:415_t:CDS:1 [Acaulospora morrowiae]
MNPESITVPFPPSVKPQDFVPKVGTRASKKSPNAFFIYRKAFLNQLRVHNCKIKMTDVSPFISASWRRETLQVKEAYKEISRQVEKLTIEMSQKKKSIHKNLKPTPVYLESKEVQPPPQYHHEITNYFEFSSASNLLTTEQNSLQFQPVAEDFIHENLPLFAQPQPIFNPFYVLFEPCNPMYYELPDNSQEF